MPQYFSTYRDEFAIADGPTHDLSVDRPQVTAIGTDRFVIVWQGAGPGGTADIWAQVIDTAGLPLTEVFRVNTTIAGSQRDPQVEALPGGGFIVAWNDQGELRARGYTSEYTPFGLSDFIVSGEHGLLRPGFYSGPDLAVTGSGEMLVSWTSVTPVVGSAGNPIQEVPTVWARLLGTNGVPLGTPFVVKPIAAREDGTYPEWQSSGPVLALASGAAGYVVTLVSPVRYDGTPDTLYHYFFQRISPSGDKSGNLVEIGFNPTGLADLGDGRFVIVGGGFGPGTDSNEIFARVYSNNGDPLGSSFVVNSTHYSAQISPSVAAFQDGSGGFLVTWEEISGEAVMGQAFNGDLTPLQGEFVVSKNVYDNPSPQVAIDDANNIVVTWRGWSDDYETSIRAEIYNDFVRVPTDSLFSDELDWLNFNTLTQAQRDEIATLNSQGRIGEIYWAFGDDDIVRLPDISSYTLATGILWDPNQVFHGHVGDDLVSGGNGNDRISGGDGSDQLNGNAGNDSLEGGWGDDSLEGGWIDGGFGTDSAIWSIGEVTGYTLAPGAGANVGTLVVSRTGGTPGAVARVGLDAAGQVTVTGLGSEGLWGIDTLSRIDQVIFSALASAGATTPTVALTLAIRGADAVLGTTSEILLGASTGERLIGSTQVDAIYGNGGADYLTGGLGDDLLSGGDGVDRVGYYHVDTAQGGVTVSLLLQGQVQDTGAAGGSDLLLGFENVSGTPFADTLTGDGGDNWLWGSNAIIAPGNVSVSNNDTIFGGGGDDVITVGIGSHVLDGGAGVDALEFFEDNAGTSGVTISLLLQGQVQNTGQGNWRISGFEDVFGDLGADVLTGDNVDNYLSGYFGNDWLNGNGGADVLNGGADADTMRGGAGNDRYIVDHAGDTVTELKDEGTDTVESSVSFNLSGQYVEVLMLTGSGNIDATGNNQANTLIGNAGNNVLKGGGDADTMRGGAGNDRYIVDNAGDKVTELKDEGTDTVESSVSFNLSGQYVEVLTLTGSGNINATGNNQANTLNGNAGNNVLTAGGGNDTLNGGLGADTLVGGLGNDRYVVDNAGDKVTELKNEGTDTVESSVSFNLSGQYVEVLTLTGSGNINATGNNQANTLNGNAGNNVLTAGGGNDTLNGGTGADTMVGGTGNDRYIVDNAGDKVTELKDEGTDTVESSVSFNLSGQYVEGLQLTGSGNIDATGNNQANTLNGNSGNNVLTGGGGNDTLTGGGGADSFKFGSALGAGNVDTITDYSVPNDGILLDDAVFTGLATGALSAAAFHTGAAAADASDRIIYNSATGALLFDVDGVGGVAAVQFATLTAGLAMTNSEFLVV